MDSKEDEWVRTAPKMLQAVLDVYRSDNMFSFDQAFYKWTEKEKSEVDDLLPIEKPRQAWIVQVADDSKEASFTGRLIRAEIASVFSQDIVRTIDYTPAVMINTLMVCPKNPFGEEPFGRYSPHFLVIARSHTNTAPGVVCYSAKLATSFTDTSHYTHILLQTMTVRNPRGTTNFQSDAARVATISSCLENLCGFASTSNDRDMSWMLNRRMDICLGLFREALRKMPAKIRALWIDRTLVYTTEQYARIASDCRLIGLAIANEFDIRDSTMGSHDFITINVGAVNAHHRYITDGSTITRDTVGYLKDLHHASYPSDLSSLL